MIAERIQQSYTNAKYYQFYTVATILEHVIDCFHTIVSDETNPYHPPLSWLTRKQVIPYEDELFLDLISECSSIDQDGKKDIKLSSNLRNRLEKCNTELRKDIVSRLKDGCSPLFIACKSGYHNIVKYLLDVCSADIEQKGLYEALEDHHVHSASPIWVAAVTGNLEIVRMLIEHGANVNSLSDTGSTPLRSVCFLCKDNDGLKSNDDEDELGLFETVSESDIYMDIVRILVENGADVLRPNFNGGTCLINSLHNYELTQFMIDQGANINASDHQSKTALHYAVQYGRLEVTKLLLAYGADPMLRANFCDDALQLSCLGGHLEVFEHLIKVVNYSNERISDAYKLIGSSILELHHDIPQVRKLWHKALKVSTQSQYKLNNTCQEHEFIKFEFNQCDSRRLVAFGDITEFSNDLELQSLSADDFGIQSLLISERVLGSSHRETIQRLLYRGTFYINSLRPDRCIDLWIYALKLRLYHHESIFHFESIIAAQVITKLFFDILHQYHFVKFNDVYDVLLLLVDQLEDCKIHLNLKPASCLHEEIFDLLLGIIVRLLCLLNYISVEPSEQHKKLQLIKRLGHLSPVTTNKSSLLHICISPGVVDEDFYKLNENGVSSLEEVINLLICNGLEVDSINSDGLSPLQVLCLSSTGAADKKRLIRLFVDEGAHVDRRLKSPEQRESMKQTLRDAGVDVFGRVKLSCLAASKVAELNIDFDYSMLTRRLKESLAIH